MPTVQEQSKYLSDLIEIARDDYASRSTVLTLVLFFTASSVACLRLLPHLRRWQELYGRAGLATIVVHTPQFLFERAPTYHKQLSTLLGGAYPIVSDLDGTDAAVLGTHLWPRLLLFGADGHILHDRSGIDDCATIEQDLRQALEQAGGHHLPPPTESGRHQHRLGRQCFPSHPDAVTGTHRGHYKNGETLTIGRNRFTDPLDRATFGLSLQGTWEITDESVQSTALTEPSDYLSFVFAGFEVNALIEPLEGKTSHLEITLDGEPLPSTGAGSDIIVSDGRSLVAAKEPRLYQLLRNDRYCAPADLRLHPRSEPVAIYLLSASGCCWPE